LTCDANPLECVDEGKVTSDNEDHEVSDMKTNMSEETPPGHAGRLLLLRREAGNTLARVTP
jgi:hypothetical protein